MTHRVDDTTIAHVMETLIANGLDGMADALAVLMNEAMKLERSKFLGAGPFERTEDRRGYANGYKDKTLRSRLGELGLRIPRALERGLRSERALTLAVAEMYVNGVSTRRVKECHRTPYPPRKATPSFAHLSPVRVCGGTDRGQEGAAGQVTGP